MRYRDIIYNFRKTIKEVHYEWSFLSSKQTRPVCIRHSAGIKYSNLFPQSGEEACRRLYCLGNSEGVIENPEKDNMLGARFVFVLDDGSEKTYYPVALTAHQYKTVSSGILSLKEKADSK